MLLTTTGAYSLGCEISERSIKIVQLKKSGLKPRIVSLAHTRLKEGVIDNGKILNEDALAKAIISATAKIKGKKLLTKEVTMAIPDSQTFVKTITVKRKEKESITEQVQKEINKHFPLDANEAYFDHQVLSETPEKLTAIISAVAKEIANPYIAVVKQLGWHLVALELESVAISRALLGKELAENVLIIDIGHAHSSLIIVAGGSIQFTLSLPVSGKIINETISHKLKLRTDQAEKAKIKCGLDEKKCQGALKIVLDAILDDLAFKIEDAFVYYDEHSAEHAPQLSTVIITGGGAHLINIENVLSVKLKRTVRKSSLEKQVRPLDTKLFGDIASQGLYSYVTPIGLALRNVYEHFV